MKYLDAVETIKLLETTYDVQSIKYKNLALWPFFRIYLCDSIKDNSTQQKVSGKTVGTIVNAILCYNPLRFFKQNKVWLLNATERRKFINGRAIHRVSGAVPMIEPKTLVIEKPDSALIHYPAQHINEKIIVSEAVIILFSHIIELFLRLFPLRFEGWKLLESMLKDQNIHFNYAYHFRYLLAQHKAMNFLLSIVPNPLLVCVECPYTAMGYVWSFKKRNIPVVELQHGVLNEKHFAYNGTYASADLYPDAVCVFGETEYEYFTNQNPNYSPLVYKTGLYILDESLNSFTNDIFSEYRKDFKSIIVIAGMNEYEQEQWDFYKKIAKINTDLLMLFIPRGSLPPNFFSEDNFIICKDVNIYEYLKWCDIHMTISSTTCLEAQYFHKPTIFYDLDKLASKYYGHILREINGGFYVSNENDFDKAILRVQTAGFTFLELFTPDNLANMRSVIGKYVRN